MKTARTSLWPVHDLRTFLLGSWRVERAVRDIRCATLAALRGTARFVPSGGAVRYEERGRLSFGLNAVAAEGSFVFQFPVPGKAAVCFGNGSPFHELDLTTGRSNIVHIRSFDVFRGRYEVIDATTWWVVWRVTGPLKDFRTVTRYRRIG